MVRLLTRFGLRFDDPRAERRFVARFMLDDLTRTQAAMLLGAFVYSFFGLWDWILDPDAFVRTFGLRVAVALTVLLPLAAALSVKRYRRFAERIYVVYCVVPGCWRRHRAREFAEVFDPFFTTRRDKGSTGLGLHIVFNLVVSTLRGQIEIDSAPGRGTRCVVDLPLVLERRTLDSTAFASPWMLATLRHGALHQGD